MSKKISLCITNHNRLELLLHSFLNVVKDKRISEIVISDDCSELDIYKSLETYFEDIPKIKLYRNEKNIGMSRNKAKAIELAENDWCIIFDSDNIIHKHYIDKIYEQNWEDNIIYCPEYAEYNFNYKDFSGHRIIRQNVSSYLEMPMFECLLNTCNYFVNRKRYLDTYVYNEEMRASDTVWFNYLHLASGGSLYVVPGLKYFHRVHDGSDFAKEMDYNLRMAEKVRDKIAML